MKEFDPGMVVRLINSAVGDPMHAVNTARHDYKSVNTWILSQSGQTAFVGGAAILLPGAHVPLALADLGILMHKVAYVCQGVAGLRKCPITKESSEIDLALILALWTQAITVEDLEPMFEAERRTGIMELPDKRQVSPQNEFFECPLQTTSEILAVDKAGTKVLASLGGIFLHRLAKTLFVRMAAREGAILAIGFLPIIGAIVSGSINYNMVEQVGRCADHYYIKKVQYLDRIKAEKAATG